MRLEKSILLTLHYADIFEFPLTAVEIHRYLLYISNSLKNVEEALQQLCSSGEVEKHRGYYCLSGRTKLEEQRRQREVWSREKKLKAAKVANYIRFIPWVEMIGITGAVAAGNCTEDDDIDILIVASPHRLWLVRSILVPMLVLRGLYRKVMCPNMWLERDRLNFENNVYVAHEICQLMPLVSKRGCYEEFIFRNAWLYKYLPNFERHKTEFNENKESKRTATILVRLNTFAYRLQRIYMQRKMTTETVTLDRALFHRRDVKKQVIEEYDRRLALVE